MAITINSPGWRIRRAGAPRGAVRGGAEPLPGVPAQFLTPESRIAEEAVLDPAPVTRGREAAPAAVDVSFDVEPGQTAILAVRHPSQALTFHLPIEATSRGARAAGQVRFQVPLGRGATRGLVSGAIKAILINIAKFGADKAVSLLMPKLAAAVERAAWQKRGLREGWLGVTPETLASGALIPRTPVAPARSLLLLHGTFSDAASAYRSLAGANGSFFDRVRGVYGDRIFAYNHFSVSRTPEENARLLLEALPDQATTFDVITHSRGGLVLRTLVERQQQFANLGGRFILGRAVLVAAPNDGTPLATATRWDETVGWLANVLEMFPDNPFTTGAEFVANGLVWLANHVTGDLPGLQAMATDSDVIESLQGPPRPPENAYSALVANYQPTATVLQRLLDVGLDQFFASANDLVVPSEGGWRVDRSTKFIPGDRIGCFGPGGNLPGSDVTHVNIFGQHGTADFLVNALLAQPQRLELLDPRKALPDRRLVRRDMVDAPARPAAASRTAARSSTSRPASGAEDVLRITVVNGDLTFESAALLLGHYRAMKLTGTEAVMDRLVGGAMQRSLKTGVYPVAVGTHQVFVNKRPNLERGSFMPRPKAVIVAGLGDEGQLAPHDLVETVRQAVIAWAQRLSEDQTRPGGTTDLAATLLGSGGTGVGAGDAARLIAQGVVEANAFIDEAFEGHLPRVRHLRLIELYLERAADAWRALSLQADAPTHGFVLEGAVKPGVGPLVRQPDSSYRGAEFDFITVEARQERDGSPSIAYTLDTKRARSEVRAQRTQGPLVGELVATASNDLNADEQIGRTLFDLLVPPELDAYLVGRGDLQISLDLQTAPIPWELLDTTRDNPNNPANNDDRELPWAIRVKLLRKLRLQEFRDPVKDTTSDATVLVIGEPACDGPRLFGARTEALAVSQCFRDADRDVTALISADESERGADARTIINKLFEQPWRIVHVAGHGLPGERPHPGEPAKPGGVVLSNGTFLGPGEIRSLRTVPALVFLNCCHLGKMDSDQLLNTYNRAEFASGVAGALIQVGVRCVVAAGWAVDDEAARVFAETFYRSLIEGHRFISAVGRARLAAYEAHPSSNTWGAYQCYGDPDWVFGTGATVIQQRDESPIRFPSAMSLKLALEEIIVKSRFQGADPAVQTRRLMDLADIADDPDRGWGAMGDVAELFGSAFAESGDLVQAQRWYERAVAAPDGRASIKAAEQLANVKSRLAWAEVDKAVRQREAMKAKAQVARQTASQRAASRRALADADAAVTIAAARGNRLVSDAVAILGKLSAVEVTMERESLAGSALKRRVLINTAAGRRYAATADLRHMLRHYLRAETIGQGYDDADLYYPGSNCLSAEFAMHAGRAGWKGPDKARVLRLSHMLADRSARDPDFWGVIGEIDLTQYEALEKRRLSKVAPRLAKAYDDLHNRVKGTRMWTTVYDNACFVLGSYGRRTTGAERAAAQRLVAQLRVFAFPEMD